MNIFLLPNGAAAEACCVVRFSMAMVTLELESAEVPELGDSAAWSASPAALAAAGNAPCASAAGPATAAPELAA